MNKVILKGNIVKDSELIIPKNEGTPYSRFTLAVNERLGKDKEKTNFIPCIVWGKMAEGLVDYLVKGTTVVICGRLDIENKEGDYEGEYKTYVNINVSELDFCGGKKQDSQEQKQDKKPRQERQRRK